MATSRNNSIKRGEKCAFLAVIAITIQILFGGGQVASQSPKPGTSGADSGGYITKYDYLDIDQIIRNDRILRYAMDCIMDRGPCTREGKILKRIIPDALKTDCSKCNAQQRRNTGRVLSYLLQYKPKYWYELLQKFDPDKIYRRRLGVEDEDLTSKAPTFRRYSKTPTRLRRPVSRKPSTRKAATTSRKVT